MKDNKEYRTTWSREDPPYGAFDDFVVFESMLHGDRMYIRPEEFGDLMSRVSDCYQEGRIKYIQILKEWNELTGFCDIDETPSRLHDIKEFIDSLRMIRGAKNKEFAKIMQDDIQLVIDFLVEHQNGDISIRKE
jgi:hypothetical protein